MICPLCGKQAKTARGLRKHMMGTRPYGGHEVVAPEAVFAAAVASGQSDSDVDAYLTQALATLAGNKLLPKFQFERAVDAFLGVFLPELVGLLLGDPGGFDLVVQEFPLKKKDNFQSTNVDYVFHGSTPSDRPWIFLELKTDTASIDKEQLRIYAERLPTIPMTELLKDLIDIRNRSKQWEKYDVLLERLAKFEPAGYVRMAYLTPIPLNVPSLMAKAELQDLAAAFEPILTCWTFESLMSLEVQTFPKTWSLFREAVLAPAASW